MLAKSLLTSRRTASCLTSSRRLLTTLAATMLLRSARSVLLEELAKEAVKDAAGDAAELALDQTAAVGDLVGFILGEIQNSARQLAGGGPARRVFLPGWCDFRWASG